MYGAPPMRRTTAFSGPFLAIPKWAMDLMTTTGEHTHLPTLAGLVSLCDTRSHSCRVTVDGLAASLNLSVRTVQRSLKWLQEQSVVSVRRGSGNTPSMYVVNYEPVTNVTKVVSRVTPRVVTRMSPPSRTLVGVGVTNLSPPDTPLALTPQGFQPSPIEVLGSTNELGHREGKGTYGPCASAPEASVILGADPNEDKPAPAKKGSEVNSLVKHFVLHPQVVMSRTYPPVEVSMLRKTMKLLLAGGVTRSTAVQMIDKFYETDRFRTSDRAAFLFSSKKIQSELLASIGGTVGADDPLLGLMLTDFEREGVDLPWSAVYDADLRRAVVSVGLDACYRYPELVASLAYTFPGDFTNELFVSALASLNDLILAIANNQTDITHLLQLVPIALPKELTTANSTGIRTQAGTIVEAVYRYQRG